MWKLGGTLVSLPGAWASRLTAWSAARACGRTAYAVSGEPIQRSCYWLGHKDAAEQFAEDFGGDLKWQYIPGTVRRLNEASSEGDLVARQDRQKARRGHGQGCVGACEARTEGGACGERGDEAGALRGLRIAAQQVPRLGAERAPVALQK